MSLTTPNTCMDNTCWTKWFIWHPLYSSGDDSSDTCCKEMRNCWAQVHCWPLMVGHRLTWTGAASWARWEDPPAEEQLLSCLPRHQARSSEWISLTISSLQKPVCAQSWIVHVGWGRTASQWGRIILEKEAEGPTWCSQTSPSHSKYIHNPLVSIYKVWGVLSLQTSTLLHQVQQQQHWRYWNLLPQQPQSAQQLQIWTQTRARMTDN